MKEIKKGELSVQIYDDRLSMGKGAADYITSKISDILRSRDQVNIIFASAPSQNEFLAELVNRDIDWNRVNAFHMDEYIGLKPDAPQGFARFLKDKLFSKVNAPHVFYINGGNPDPRNECQRYADLLDKYPTDIVVLGIGENTHLAFNDPHVADFNDKEIVKIVDLDDKNRHQQVDPNDPNCFRTLDEVPTNAITITIPVLMKPKIAFAIVPGKNKTDAVFHTINEEISEKFPSTILRQKKGSLLFVDRDSAARLTLS